MGVTFALYKDQQGGAPLWLETQNVAVDAAGHYSVQLGATLSHGLPTDLFASGEARWLGVQAQGQAEQARVLLLSVPYAMKAADAETIGGLPPSAFVLANPRAANATAVVTGEDAAPPSSGGVTGTGTVNTIPLWDSTSDIISSVISQTGTGTTAKIGINNPAPLVSLDVKGATTIRGLFTLPATGTATAAAGKNSQPLNLSGAAFNSTTGTSVNETFRLQTESASNNTANASGKLNLLFYSGTNAATETGLSIASNGQITFASGQTFPGTSAITGITAGSGLVGGGTSGNVSLSLSTTCAANQILKWNGTTWACSADGNSGGTIKGVTAGTALTGGGTSGTVTLNVDTTKVVTGVTAGTGLTGGGTGGAQTLRLDTTKVPLLSNTNQFTAPNSFSVNGLGTPAVSVSNLGAGDGINVSSLGNVALFATDSPFGVYAQGGNYPVIGTDGLYEGVYGDSYNDVDMASGIVGVSFGINQETFGVYGETSATFGSGVYGQNGGTQSTTASSEITGQAGVWGDGGTAGIYGMLATTDNAPAFVAANNSSRFWSILTYQFDPNGDIAYFGNSANNTNCQIDALANLDCTGAINTFAKVRGGARKVALASIQSPQNWFEDFGSGRLASGSATIRFDSDFAETVNTGIEYHVFLTPKGDCKGLYVSNEGPGSFEVHELGGGVSSVGFDYRVVALRKNFENIRLADHTNDTDRGKTLRERVAVRPHERLDVKRLIPPRPARRAAILNPSSRSMTR